MLTDAEAEMLKQALALGRGAKGCTQEEVDLLLEWATQVKAEMAFIGLIVSGRMVVPDVRCDEHGNIEVTARNA